MKGARQKKLRKLIENIGEPSREPVQIKGEHNRKMMADIRKQRGTEGTHFKRMGIPIEHKGVHNRIMNGAH